MNQATDMDMPDWWSAQDEEILRGELAKLANLPRPCIEREKERLVYVPITNVRQPKRWVREIGAWIVLAGIALGAVLLLSVGGERPMPPSCLGDPAGCADFTMIPSTAVPPPTGP